MEEWRNGGMERRTYEMFERIAEEVNEKIM